jgi:VIT1/CCC1 family predicted Fe2+/Mn2+ transporter
MSGVSVALWTYGIAFVISLVVACLILAIRNLLSGDRKSKSKSKKSQEL